MEIHELINTYPRKRLDLPDTYKKIYEQHYEENRNGKTKVSFLSSKLEHWLHRKVAKSGIRGGKTKNFGDWSWDIKSIEF